MSIKSFFNSAPVVAFCFSRVIIFSIIILAAQTRLDPIPAREGRNFHAELQFDLHSSVESIHSAMLAADASWYLGIAKHGYHSVRHKTLAKNWVFFPLYPILIRFFGLLFESQLIAGLLLSNCCFLGALFLLQKFSCLAGYSERESTTAIWSFAFFPTSYFFSAPFTESLFLLLLLASFTCLFTNRTLFAALLFAALTATRPTGLLLLPAFYYVLYQCTHLRSFVSQISLLVAPLGIIAFMIYLNSITGNPLAFAANQAAWGRTEGERMTSVMTLLSATPQLIGPWNFQLLNCIVVVITAVVISRFVRRQEWHWVLLLVVPVIAALATGFTLSLTRIVMPLFPLQLELARMARSEASERLLLLGSAALLAVLSVLYALHVTAAMT